MRLLAVALVTLAASTPKASLRVTYWPHGAGAAPVTWTLKCTPLGGTHPLRARSCAILKLNAALLGPATKPCTILSRRDAPTATVTGTYAGRTVLRSYRAGCPGWDELRLVLTGT